MCEFTFEQLKPALYKWAKRYYSRDFEFWELINEAWLSSRVKSIKQIETASIAVKRAMIEYMRENSKSKKRSRYEKTGREWPTFHSLDDDNAIGRILPAKPIASRVETDDFFQQITKGFSSREKLIINLIYRAGLSQAETSRAVGLTQSYISIIHKNLKERIKARYIDINRN